MFRGQEAKDGLSHVRGVSRRIYSRPHETVTKCKIANHVFHVSLLFQRVCNRKNLAKRNSDSDCATEKLTKDYIRACFCRKPHNCC